CPNPLNEAQNPPVTGWTKAHPCAYIYYDVVQVPGFDIQGNRPVKCTNTSPADCDAPQVIGSSVQLGINVHGGAKEVPAWCDKKLTRVPCTFKYNWLNKATGK